MINIPHGAFAAEQSQITVTSGSATSSKATVSAQGLPSIAGMMTSSSDRAGANEEKHFPFLQLPAELRLLVYEHLLVAEGLWRVHRRGNVNRNTSRLYPNITATCKIVYREATPILYGHNEFKFDRGTRELGSFMNEISESAQYVSAARVDHMSDNRKQTKAIFVLLKKCKALSKLTVGYSLWHSHAGPEAVAKSLGPLARLLHKNQQKKQDLKARDVLDGLHFPGVQVHRDLRDAVARQAEEVNRAAAFEKAVKDLLRATFK
ncbi:hypothetical protein CBER1_08969 [Cercospora berteroae]|uniref:F-box domain-containing protein n=1 Tax=Cercospora berteroae TaxID=357750 RepID=A0A2S6C5E9_9PEZI|nr:hypothetical protein CBER1_08969 [Cercospora berteroae]